MKIGLYVSAAAIVMAGSLHASEHQPRPKFEFRGLTVGSPKPKGGILGCPKTRNKREWICVAFDMEVAGIRAKSFASVYDDDGLSMIILDIDRSSGPTLKAALREKYGEPCHEGSTDLQNGFGAKFTREITSWCFEDGVGSFQSIGSKITEARFMFTTLKSEADKPVVDF